MYNDEKYFEDNKFLDEVLKTDPGFTLSANFAEKIAAKVERKLMWKEYVAEFLIYLSSFTGIAAVVVAMAFIWYDANWQKWVEFLAVNFGMVIGISILLVFILFADRVLLRYFFYRSASRIS